MNATGARLTAGMALLALSMASCRRDTPPPTKATPATPADSAAARPERTDARARIVSVTPSTIAISDGHAAAGTYTVEYEIDHVENVVKAELDVAAPGIGQFQSVPITPGAHGAITFDLDPKRSDFGPTVRFRARCPGGDTEWFTLGSERLSSEEYSRPLLRVAGVSPDYISLDAAAIAGRGEVPPNSGVPVGISGPLLTADCTPEASVNGAPVALGNVFPDGHGFRALLLYRDIGTRYVSSRFLEVQLHLRGAGFANMTIRRVLFVE